MALSCSLDLRGTGVASGTGGGTGEGGSSGGEGGADGLPDGMLYGWAASEPAQPGIYELPLWLSLESPTPDKTVQVSESAMVSGIAAGVARARRVGEDSPWGLSLESARENRIPMSTPSAEGPWRRSHEASVEEALGPDGTMSAARISDDDPDHASAISVSTERADGSTSTSRSTLSGWVGDVSGEDGSFAWIEVSAFDAATRSDASTKVPAPANGWRRIDFTGVEVERIKQIAAYPAAGDEARSEAASFAFLNFETARYPSSAITTSDGPRTREADVLYASNAEWLIWKGWLKATLELAPNYASGEQLTDHDLLYIDPGNRVFLRASDGAIVMTATGSEGTATLAAEGLSWEREQAIEVEVVSSSSGLSLHVAIEGEQDVSVEDPTVVGAIPVPASGRIHILGGPDGSQECADLRRVAFYEVY